MCRNTAPGVTNLLAPRPQIWQLGRYLTLSHRHFPGPPPAAAGQLCRATILVKVRGLGHLAVAVESGDQLSRTQRARYIFILALAISFIPFTIDPYLPAFPEVAKFFGLPNGVVQSSLAGVTLGLAIGQLVAGPLSDAFGRRVPLILALAGFGFSAIAVFFAPSFTVLLVLRFSMAFFAASADVIARAVVRDLYKGSPMQQMLGRIYLIQALAPIVGPIVGAQLLGILPWQGVFVVFGLIGLVVALGTLLSLTETLPKAQRRSSTPIGLARGFRSVLKDRVYIGLMIFGATQIAGLFAYLNTVSFLYQESFGLSQSEFGFWFALNAVASYLGVQIGTALAKIFPGQWMLLVYGLLGVLAGVLMVVTADLKSLVVAQLLFILQFLAFGAGITTVPTFALLNHGSEAGTAASLLGVMNFAVTAALAGVYASLSTADTSGAGLLIAALNFISVAALLVIARPWLIPDLRTK